MHFHDDDRVARLQRALDGTLIPAPPIDSTPEGARVERLAALIARIDALTREMRRPRVQDLDAVDVLTSRLLVHAMKEALATCRGLTGPARERILASLETVRQAGRSIDRRLTRQPLSDGKNPRDAV